MKRTEKPSIPTPEEFAAASKAMETRLRQGKELKSAILSRCGSTEILHDVWTWVHRDRCHVDIFVRLDADLQTDEAEKLRSDALDVMHSSITSGEEISVALDSDERVQREFNGNYDQRFR
jgi:hypothetical protein